MLKVIEYKQPIKKFLHLRIGVVERTLLGVKGLWLGGAGNLLGGRGRLDSEEDRSVNLFVTAEVAPPGPSSGESSFLFPLGVVPEYAPNRVSFLVISVVFALREGSY